MGYIILLVHYEICSTEKLAWIYMTVMHFGDITWNQMTISVSCPLPIAKHTAASRNPVSSSWNRSSVQSESNWRWPSVSVAKGLWKSVWWCRYRKTDTDTLHIINVEKSDKGCYRCLVMNDKKQTVVSNEALLTVGKFLSTYSCYVSVEIHFMHYRSKCKFRDY